MNRAFNTLSIPPGTYAPQSNFNKKDYNFKNYHHLLNTLLSGMWEYVFMPLHSMITIPKASYNKRGKCNRIKLRQDNKKTYGKRYDHPIF